MPVPKKLKEENMHPGFERNGSSTLYDDETSTTTSINNIANGVSSVRALPIKLNNKIGFRKKFSTSYDMKQQQRSDDPFRFTGEGIDFKAKFIGEQDVMEARGDQMCQNAMQVCKANVKRRGEHKQRIWFNITLKGFKIKDQLTGVTLFNFPVNKVSFIAKDITDNRAFGFVYGSPDEKHKFFAIKTEKSAKPAVFSIRDMFQIVYEIKKKQIEDAKHHQSHSNTQKQPTPTEPQTTHREDTSDCVDDVGGVPVENLLDLELELENLEQGMRTMNDWAAFSAEDSSNAENGQMVHSVSAPNGYHSDLEWNRPKQILNSRNAQSDDSNVVLFHETSFDPVQNNLTRPVFHTNTNDTGVISPLQPPPVMFTSRRAHNSSLFNNNSSDLFGISSHEVTSPVSASKVIPTYPVHDPFDTSHVGQILHESNGHNIQPIGNGMTHMNIGPQTNGFNAQNSSFDILEPMNFLPPVQQNLFDNNSNQISSLQQTPSANVPLLPNNNNNNSGFDSAFEKLCNLENLSNASTQKLQTIGVIPTTSLGLKQSSSKKSMNEIREEKADGSSSFGNPLSPSQMSNIPSLSPSSSLNFLTNNSAKVPSNNNFFDEDLLQNGANNLPAIPPRTAQINTSALPRPGANQRLSKGLLPPPLSTGHTRQSTETKSDPFADDFFQ